MIKISQETNKELAAIHLKFSFIFFTLLILTIVVTSISSFLSRKDIHLEEKREFELAKNEILHWVHARVLAYHITLRGMSAFFQNSEEVTLNEWANYVKDTELLKYYPGVSAFGFTQYVPHEDLAAYTTKMKKIYPNFETNANHDEYHYIVTYVEPYVGREKSIGFDQSTEEHRKKIIESIRDSGNISNSLLIDLVTTHGKGFFLAAPVYKSNTPLGSVEQRREAFRGVVFASFREDQPFSTILSEGEPYQDFDIEVYDNGTLSEEGLLYDSDPSLSALQPPAQSRFSEKIPIDFEDHKWTLVITTKETFGLNQARKTLTWMPTAASGVFIFLLIGFSAQQAYMHRKLLHGMMDHQPSSN